MSTEAELKETRLPACLPAALRIAKDDPGCVRHTRQEDSEAPADRGEGPEPPSRWLGWRRPWPAAAQFARRLRRHRDAPRPRKVLREAQTITTRFAGEGKAVKGGLTSPAEAVPRRRQR